MLKISDLDFDPWPHEKRPTPRPRPLPSVDRVRETAGRQRRLMYAVAVAAAVVVLFAIGSCTGRAAGSRTADTALLARAEAENKAAMIEGERDYWKGEAAETSETIAALMSELASATARIDSLVIQSEAASATIDSLERKVEAATIRPQARTVTPKPPAPTQVSYNTSGVEQWRSLVAQYFKAENVDAALSVMRKESGGNPNARNKSSGASGLFQQMPQYWAARLARAETAFGKDFSDNIFDPEANIAASAVLSSGGSNWSHWSAKP